MSGRDLDGAPSQGTSGIGVIAPGRSGSTTPTAATSWYEQIQFKAQYHHFRTNNYVAFIKSANSLDKVTTLPTVTVTSPSPLTKTKTRAVGKHRCDAGGEEESESLSASSPAVQSDCWNFPRVKLRKIFNAKSLDDILSGGSSASSKKLIPLPRRSVPDSSSNFLHLPKSRPRSSSTESATHHQGAKRSSNPTKLLAHSKSSTDVEIEHRQFQYIFPQIPQVGSISSSSSDSYIPSQILTSNIDINNIKPLIKINDQSDSLSPDTSNQLQPNIKTITMKPSTTTHFLKNRVEPASGSTEGRKLVVASVSYLQRPRSPSPLTPAGTPSQPPTPLGLSPSSTSIFINSPSTSSHQEPINSAAFVRPPPSKSTHRFFTSCCGSGNEINLEPFVLNNENNEEFRKRRENIKVPVSILKNVQPIGSASTMCSKDSSRGVRYEHEHLGEISRKKSKEVNLRSTAETTVSPACSSGAKKETQQENRKEEDAGGSGMADLQSPHYVKRTAHMFNSKYITSSTQNGSHNSPDGSHPTSTACSPSYLNVSRSVSGYSCLSYNSGVNVSASNGHQLNNNNNNGKTHSSRTPFRTNRSVLRHHSSFPSQSPNRFSPSRKYSDSSPPPLPKSAPPLRSPSLVGQSDQQRPNGRSLILEKIERLYGQSELDSTSFIWRRMTPPRSNSIERIIPISIDDYEEPSDMKKVSSNGFHAKLKVNGDKVHMPESLDEVDKSLSSLILPGYSDEDKIGQEYTKESIDECPVSSPIAKDSSSGEQLDETISNESLQELPSFIVPIAQSESEMAPVDKENEPKVIEKDGDYFLIEITREKKKIEGLIESATEELANVDPQSDESGKIRAAIGKARLLVNKKFKQFEGLCHTNLQEARYGVPPGELFPTKNEDLAGFWDMVLIQVDQIYLIFDDLDPKKSKLMDQTLSHIGKSDGKKLPLKKSGAMNKSTTIKTSKLKPSVTPTSARDESLRKLLAEKRKEMKTMATQENTVPGASEGQTFDIDPSTEVRIFTPPNEK